MAVPARTHVEAAPVSIQIIRWLRFSMVIVALLDAAAHCQGTGKTGQWRPRELDAGGHENWTVAANNVMSGWGKLVVVGMGGGVRGGGVENVEVGEMPSTGGGWPMAPREPGWPA